MARKSFVYVRKEPVPIVRKKDFSARKKSASEEELREKVLEKLTAEGRSKKDAEEIVKLFLRSVNEDYAQIRTRTSLEKLLRLIEAGKVV